MGMITIAFDDAYKETFENCAEYLSRNGIKATFSVPVSFIGEKLENRPVIDDRQIAFLIENGHEIASHTMSHRNLLDLFTAEGEEAVRNEMAAAKEKLESSFGTVVDSMVFPFIEANQNPLLRDIAAEYYNSSRITTEKAAFNRLPVKDPYSVTGVAFTRDIPVGEYAKLVDIVTEYDFWLIEVFHFVSGKNTKSAHRDERYRFFTHIDDFKGHLQYILSKKIPILTQNEVIQRHASTG